MPKYFSCKEEQLLVEALATTMIIEGLCAQSVKGGMIPDRLHRIFVMSQERCARRNSKFYAWIKIKGF